MKYSLISRDLIADCAELMHQAYAAVSGLDFNWGEYNKLNCSGRTICTSFPGQA